MKLFGYFPEAVLQNPKSALLICFGTGSTAASLVRTSAWPPSTSWTFPATCCAGRISSIQARAQSPGRPARGHPRGGRPLLPSGLAQEVRHHHGRAAAAHDGRGGQPLFPGIFQLMRERLADGGMVTYWLPVFEISPDDAKAILKAFSEVFEHASLWTGDNFNWMMVGVKKPRGPKPAKDFPAPWQAEETGPGLTRIGVEDPAQLGALFMLDGQSLADYLGEAKPLTDNYPKRLRGYPESPEVQKAYLADHNKLLDAMAAKERFAASAEAAASCPRRAGRVRGLVRDPADHQHLPKQHATPPPPLPAVNYVLSGTDLRVLPLWLMKSDAKKQDIVSKVLASGLAPTAETEFQLGIRALAERDYLLADAKLKRAQDLATRATWPRRASTCCAWPGCSPRPRTWPPWLSGAARPAPRPRATWTGWPGPSASAARFRRTARCCLPERPDRRRLSGRSVAIQSIDLTSPYLLGLSFALQRRMPCRRISIAGGWPVPDRSSGARNAWRARPPKI